MSKITSTPSEFSHRIASLTHTALAERQVLQNTDFAEETIHDEGDRLDCGRVAERRVK